MLKTDGNSDDVSDKFACEELDALKDQIDLTIIHVLRKTPEDWSGETGYVDKELLERYIPIHRGTRNYFICAAPKMM